MSGGEAVAVVGADGAFGSRLARGLTAAGVPVASLAGDDGDFAGALAGAGPLRGVVDASWQSPVAAPLTALADDAWSAAAEEPLRRALRLFQATFPVLGPTGGRVVVILPSVSLTGVASMVAAVTAAEGCRALVKVAARAWGPSGVTVNTLVVPAPLLAADESVPAARPGSPPPALGGLPDVERDVVPVVATLLGDGMRPVTGMTIAVDGGVWMTP